MAGQVVAAVLEQLQEESIDACTLNNALNIAQLIALGILIRLFRRELVR